VARGSAHAVGAADRTVGRLRVLLSPVLLVEHRVGRKRNILLVELRRFKLMSSHVVSTERARGLAARLADGRVALPTTNDFL